MTTTKNLGRVKTTSGEEHCIYLNSTDGTEAELKFVNTPGDTGKSLGDAIAGKSIAELDILAATPSDVDRVTIYDSNNGIVFETFGCITAALAPLPNVELRGLNIPIKKGMTLKILTSD